MSDRRWHWLTRDEKRRAKRRIEREALRRPDP